jgi:copper(I)-binding protein
MRWMMGLLLTAAAIHATAAGRLVVTQAWVRSPAPGAMMLAAYATLRNEGDAPLTVTGADSADFGDVSLHHSLVESGIERMRALDKLDIAPGASVEFAPGGRHFMLMRPKRALQAGDKIIIHIVGEPGADVTTEFTVSDAAP